MKKEDALAYAIEIRERQYNFMKFLNNSTSQAENALKEAEKTD